MVNRIECPWWQYRVIVVVIVVVVPGISFFLCSSWSSPFSGSSISFSCAGAAGTQKHWLDDSTKLKTNKMDTEPPQKKHKKDKKDKKAKKEKKDKKEKKNKKDKKDKKKKKDKKRSRASEELLDYVIPASADVSSSSSKRPKVSIDPVLLEQCTASCGKVFVSGLKIDATDASICEYFEKECGIVDDTYWLTDRKTGLFRGSGFMTFEEPDIAVVAIGMSGATECPVAEGTDLKVVPARPMASWKGTMHSGKTTKVFVKNMNYEITEEDLVNFFATHAERAKIHEVQWREDDGGNFDGTAIVEFTSAGGAALAIDCCHGVEFLGRNMTCKPATARMAQGITDGVRKPSNDAAKKIKPLSERPEGGTTVVFVGNVPFAVTDEEMTEFFGGDEKVKVIRWLEHQDTGKFKGCGFVEFHSSEDVDEMVKLNGTDFGGRNIQIDYSFKKKEGDANWTD